MPQVCDPAVTPGLPLPPQETPAAYRLIQGALPLLVGCDEMMLVTFPGMESWVCVCVCVRVACLLPHVREIGSLSQWSSDV